MAVALTTERLLIRSFTLSDAAAIHRVYSDPDVMAHVGNGAVGDLAETQAMLRDYIAHERLHGFSFWAVVERAGGAIIGDAGLYLLEGRGPDVELGYTLGRRWWGRGYATEAARACIEHGTRELRLADIVAVADPANPASARVLEKVGMRPAGSVVAYGREHRRYRLEQAPGHSRLSIA